jgi:hypothetical protein
LCHAYKLAPIKDLLKYTFNDVVDNTDHTDALFLITMLYSAGKSDFTGHGLIESAFAPYVGFGVLMTSKLGTNGILMRYIVALVP